MATDGDALGWNTVTKIKNKFVGMCCVICFQSERRNFLNSVQNSINNLCMSEIITV